MIRIVKMHFRPETADQFFEFYQTVYPKISTFPGCQSVQLLRDILTPEIFFTYSFWEDEGALHRYRHSELFIDTWKKTKPLFAEKAQAWSVEAV